MYFLTNKTMAKINIGKGMEFDPDTKELFVEGLDKPIITESVSEAAQLGAEEYLKILEGGEKVEA